MVDTFCMKFQQYEFTSFVQTLARYTAAGCLSLMAYTNTVLADISVVLGVYAYDDHTKLVWTCDGVLHALEERMTRELEEDVHVIVRVDADYQRGVIDIAEGAVQFARFPNIDEYWVIHPSVSLGVIEAWRDAVVELRLEDLLRVWQHDLTSARVDRRTFDDKSRRIEDEFGSCEQLGQRIAAG